MKLENIKKVYIFEIKKYIYIYIFSKNSLYRSKATTLNYLANYLFDNKLIEMYMIV